MIAEARYVFDANVIVSALLFEQSVPGQAFYAAVNHGHILLSQPAFRELADVLSREKFDRYMRFDERERFLVAFVYAAEWVEVDQTVRACRDPRDDKYLELAAYSNASCIVSGDEDLLALHPFRGIGILTPSQFLRFIEG
jgi:putative PIN family toxin of toxin-antitoxin system